MVPFSCNDRRTHASTSLLVSPALWIGQCVARGRALTASGKSHSCETATTLSIKPSSAAISVPAGSNETMRVISKTSAYTFTLFRSQLCRDLRECQVNRATGRFLIVDQVAQRLCLATV